MATFMDFDGDVDFSPIGEKLAELIEQAITDGGHIRTGEMLANVQVETEDNGSCYMSTEDYYQYVDNKYDLSHQVAYSDDFTDFYTDFAAEHLEELMAKDLQDILDDKK